ncbi:MAG: hypothetical protein AABZ53_17340, partial [Planctomycetota bacterium]
MKGGSDQSAGNPGEHARRGKQLRTDYTEFGYRDCDAADPIDAYFDGEADRRSAEFRGAFVKSRKFRSDVAATEEMISDLKRPLKGPDLSARILAAVDDRKPFVTGQARRIVTVGRLAAAASILLLLTGAVLVERMRPGTIELTPRPTPVSGLVDASPRLRPPHPATSQPRAIASLGAPEAGSPGESDPASASPKQPENPWLGRVMAVLGRPVRVEIVTNPTYAVHHVATTDDRVTWMA